MSSFADIVDSLQQQQGSIDIPDKWTFIALHKWLSHHGHIKRDKAVVIVLVGATYVVYDDFPDTTLIVCSTGTLKQEDFTCIRYARFFGEYSSTDYSFRTFLREIVTECYKPLLGILSLSALTVIFALGDFGLLIDKSIDVAAIAAAFLTLFLSFKSEPRKVDRLWFRRGEYGKHFRVDRYTLTLTGMSLVLFLLLMIVQPSFYRYVLGQIVVAAVLALGWSSLYAGFHVVMSYHVDRLETDRAKELADNIRDELKKRDRQ